MYNNRTHRTSEVCLSISRLLGDEGKGHKVPRISTSIYCRGSNSGNESQRTIQNYRLVPKEIINMAQTITEEQRQQLQSTILANGSNAWEYVLQHSEDTQYWVASGILSCMKKGRLLNRLTIFWEIEDLRNSPKRYKRESRQYAPSKELIIMEHTTHGLLESKSEDFSKILHYLAGNHSD